MINKEIFDAWSNLVNVYNEYLDNCTNNEKQLDIHKELNDISKKIANHMEENDLFTDDSCK